MRSQETSLVILEGKTHMKRFVSLLSFAAALVIGAQSASAQTTVIKGVTFVAPTSAEYAGKIDFAELERKFPLDKNALKSWTANDLAALNQEQLDQFYARLTAGPMPDGPYYGKIVFTKDGGLEGIARQFVPIDPLISGKFLLLRNFGEFLWKGKHFYKDEGVLRNMIEDGLGQRAAIKAIAWGLLGTNPHFDQFVHTKIASVNYLEMFPSKLYCGQSLMDSRRESVIIDYAYGDTVPGYNSDVDFLATREGLGVRDEIRMVHPGLYLGRAYLRQVFGLIFTLTSDTAAQAGDSTESCWSGTQPRQ
jgi:hypothetical protein